MNKIYLRPCGRRSGLSRARRVEFKRGDYLGRGLLDSRLHERGTRVMMLEGGLFIPAYYRVITARSF